MSTNTQENQTTRSARESGRAAAREGRYGFIANPPEDEVYAEWLRGYLDVSPGSDVAAILERVEARIAERERIAAIPAQLDAALGNEVEVSSSRHGYTVAATGILSWVDGDDYQVSADHGRNRAHFHSSHVSSIEPGDSPGTLIITLS